MLTIYIHALTGLAMPSSLGLESKLQVMYIALITYTHLGATLDVYFRFDRPQHSLGLGGL